MTRNKAKECLPIIEDFANGEDIEIWDTSNLIRHKRGWWVKADIIGFGAGDIKHYRKVKDGIIYWYDGRPNEPYTNELYTTTSNYY